MKDILRRLGYVVWWASLVCSFLVVIMMIYGVIVLHAFDFGFLLFVGGGVLVMISAGRAIKYILSGE